MAGLAVAALFPVPVLGQQAPTPAAPEAPAADVAAPEPEALDSTEQGQVKAGDSFTSRRAQRIQQRRHALRDTEFNWQARTYDMETVTTSDKRQAAWAVGGLAGFHTGDFANRFSFGATGYTSQPLYGPSGEGGTNLLTPNQGGYTVLGEAFTQVRITDDLDAIAGRRGFDTPYINRNDTRMTPQTYELAGLQGTHGDADAEAGELRYGFGYVSREKQVNSTDFESMSQIAGASVERGVYLAGLAYTRQGWSAGVFDYYSSDILNIAYGEGRYTIDLADKRTLSIAVQYTDQHSVGEDLLTGKHFSTGEAGVKADLALGPALLTAGYSETGRGDAIKSPWTRPPAYTSVQIEDFNDAGQNATILRAACKISALPGASVYGLWVHGSSPTTSGTYSRDEYDANLQWSPASGVLHGLMFRVRYAYAAQSNDTHESQFRLMLFYTPPRK